MSKLNWCRCCLTVLFINEAIYKYKDIYYIYLVAKRELHVNFAIHPFCIMINNLVPNQRKSWLKNCTLSLKQQQSSALTQPMLQYKYPPEATRKSFSSLSLNITTLVQHPASPPLGSLLCYTAHFIPLIGCTVGLAKMN